MKLFDLFKKKPASPFAIKGDLRPYQKSVIKHLELFFKQEQYKGMFNGAFFSRLTSVFLRTGKWVSVTESDINEGISLEKAQGVYSHALSLCSLRGQQEVNIASLRKGEVKRIRLKVSRSGKGCVKTPKEKSYKPSANIPLYPCLDCECDPRCDVWYKGEW